MGRRVELACGHDVAPSYKVRDQLLHDGACVCPKCGRRTITLERARQQAAAASMEARRAAAQGAR